MRRRISDAVVAILAVVALGASAAPAAATPHPLRLGFLDSDFESPNAALRDFWLDKSKAVGGTLVRMEVSWGGIAQTKPANPTDPGDPAYDWATLDAAVRDAAARGLSPLLSFNSAPGWAEGPNRDPNAKLGTWRPNAAAFHGFAQAAAKRYSGTYPDPLNIGRPLPRVRYWQVWNEPNLATYLTPQWTKNPDGTFHAASPDIYRGLLNAGYRGVKAAVRSDFVISAGTGPYGDLAPGGRRISPVEFLRDVLKKRTYLDAIAHHPYGVGGPYTHALNPGDVAVPDIVKLTRVLRAAQKKGRVLPRLRPKEVWITEMSWDSNPPDPDGVPALQQAHWLEQSFYVLWKQGVSAITWFQVGDQPPVPSYAATNQGGVYLLDGTPKVSAQAYRFPFVTKRLSHTQIELWGRAPLTGKVVVEVKKGTGWHKVFAIQVGSGGVFTAKGPLPGAHDLRARVGDQTSLVWHQR